MKKKNSNKKAKKSRRTPKANLTKEIKAKTERLAVRKSGETRLKKRIKPDEKKPVSTWSSQGGEAQSLIEEKAIQLETQYQHLLEKQQLLEESRDQYANLYDFAPLGYVTLDEKGIIRNINLTAASILSTQRAHLKGVPFFVFIAKKDSEKFLNYFKKCKDSKEKVKTELELKAKNNRSGETELQSIKFYDTANKKQLYQTSIIDISERKEAEEEKSLFASIVESSGDAIYSTNVDSEIISWNKAAKNIFGYSSNEIIGKPWSILVPSGLRKESEEIFSKVVSGERVRQVETIRVKKDGEYINVSLTFSPVIDSSGKIKLISIIARDITNRKLTEEAFRESNERFRQLAENINSVFYITDPQNDHMIYISPAYEKIWGRSCQSLYDNPQSWADTLHPDDKEKVFRAFERQKITGEFDQEYRIIRSDGKIRWIYTRAFPIKDQSGNIYRIAGIAEDITNRKKIEEELRVSKERLNTVFKETPFAIIISSLKDGKYVDVNTAFERMTGFTNKEVIGKTSMELGLFVDPQHRDSLIKKVIEEGAAREIEVKVRGRFGQVGIGLVSMIPIQIEGEPYLITVANDITERKRFERRLLAQFEVTKVLTDADNLSDAAPKILKAICEAIDWQLGEIWFADKKYRSLKYGSYWYNPLLNAEEFVKNSREYSFKLAECLPGLVWKANKPVWISNLKEDKRFRRSSLAKKINLELGLGIPVKSEGKILGVMIFFKQDISEPDNELINMLESLSNQVGDFTTRKRVEESFKESEERFRLIAEFSKDLISMLSPEGKYIYVSPSHESLLGYTREELLSMNPLVDLIHPDDLAKIANWQSTPMFEFRLQKKDGKWLWLEGMNYTVSHKDKTYIVGVSRDITERKSAIEALRESETKLFGLIDSAMDAIITINSDHNIVLFNKAAEKMFQYSAEEVLGESINMFIPKRYHIIHEKHINKFDKTGMTTREMGSGGCITGVRANREEFPLETAISQLEISGEKLFTVICRDVTEQQKYRTQIENSLKEKEVLLKEIHHRVKNNLQIISSLLNLQSNFIEDEKMTEIFKESRNRVKSMALIHEKLYQSKDLSQINIAEYLRDLSSYLYSSYRMEPNAIKLKLELEDIYLDVNFAINLGLITNELISNSLKHAFPQKRSGEISVKMHKITNNSLTLTVKDNGIGFPDNLDHTTTKSLGLQLVNSLVLQYKGTIEFLSKEGTKFIMRFTDIKTNGQNGNA